MVSEDVLHDVKEIDKAEHWVETRTITDHFQPNFQHSVSDVDQCEQKVY